MNKLISALALIFCVACSPVRISVEHDTWKQPEEMAVKGRQGVLIKQKLSFGEFATGVVKRSWTRGSSSFAGWAWEKPGYSDHALMIGKQYTEKKQSVHFGMMDNAGRESSVFCVTHVQTADFVIGANPNSTLNFLLEFQNRRERNDNLFWVKLFLKNEEQPYEMLIDNIAAQENSKTYVGVIAQSRENYFTIHPVFKTTGKNNKVYTMPLGSIGYEIRNRSGIPLAAVSLIDNGIVYFKTADKEERFLMANICSALLLQEVI